MGYGGIFFATYIHTPFWKVTNAKYTQLSKKVRNDLQSFSGRENFSIGYRFSRITEAWRNMVQRRALVSFLLELDCIGWPEDLHIYIYIYVNIVVSCPHNLLMLLL